MSEFVPNKRHLRKVLLHLYIRKESAAKAHRLLVQTYGEHALSESKCRKWFSRFKNGHFNVEDRERSGAPNKFEDAELEALLLEDSCQTQEQLAKKLGVTQECISKRLKAMGMIQKRGDWVAYESKQHRSSHLPGTA